MSVSYCKIFPKKRITGWTLVSGSIWSAPFGFNQITRAWIFNNTVLDEASDSTLSDGDWFHDGTNVYLLSASDPDTITISNPYPGLTVEFPIYLSSKDVTDYSTPIDTTTELVDWEGGLLDIPKVQNGSTDTLYGISPTNIGTVRFANDGYLNEIFHECSFNKSICKAWIDNRQVFLGYVNGFTIDEENIVSFRTTDYMSFFEKEYDMTFSGEEMFGTTEFPNLDPNLNLNGVYKRKVFGMLDNHVCINIDYNATPGLTVNRDWVSHRYETGDTLGTNIENLDNTAANTATRTYFQNTPMVNVYDWVDLVNNGIHYRVMVSYVDRALKYIDHASVGARTFTPADYCARYFIGRITIKSGNSFYYLKPGLDYTVFWDGTKNVAGFTLADNFEASVGMASPFDPTNDSMYVRVYGNKDLDQYSDLTDVGSLANEGGVVSQAVSLLFRMIKDSGFSINEIDPTSFTAIGATSHSFGFSIPERAEDTETQTYKSIIEKIIGNMLWTLSFVEDPITKEMLIGLGSYKPFIAAADYEATNDDFNGFEFEASYVDVYSNFVLNYAKKEISGEVYILNLTDRQALSTSYVASDLHGVNKTYTTESLHYDDAEAQAFIDRIKFALGDRRGIYKLNLGPDFFPYTTLGVSYDITRDHLPGFEYTRGVENSRQTALIEVQKSVEGVSISLDDQKGIQDNSGEW